MTLFLDLYDLRCQGPAYTEHFLISHECTMSTGFTVIATYVGTIKSIHLSLYYSKMIPNLE